MITRIVAATYCLEGSIMMLSAYPSCEIAIRAAVVPAVRFAAISSLTIIARHGSPLGDAPYSPLTRQAGRKA